MKANKKTNVINCEKQMNMLNEMLFWLILSIHIILDETNWLYKLTNLGLWFEICFLVEEDVFHFEEIIWNWFQN